MENIVEDNDLDYENDPVSKAAFENFGIKYLFPWQRMVIANILEAYEYYCYKKTLSPKEKSQLEKDDSDSFCKGRQIVLLPTGAGKSLCFQIPAILFNGPTLIIYPLLALMSDQQRRMEEGALRSVVFRGGQSKEERDANFEKIKNGAKIILANPEVLSSKELLEQLKQVGIIHIAIDEAHCVSEWGDSFRPSYLELGKVIEELKPPVITAFTATASPGVLSRVSEILFNGEAHVVRSESDRKNIHYYVKKTTAKKKTALLLSQTELKPMIIFCSTRNEAEDMTKELNACFGSGTSRFYHAGLDKSEKDTVEQWFFKSKDGVLCATCAYGMGVDKKDIKTVLHISPPATAEAYIQEAGRGGRDGSVAKAILLWSLQDSIDYKQYKDGSREAAMRMFAETDDCRRQVLLDSLGGEQAVCSGCDLCNERTFIKELSVLPKKQQKKQIKLHQKQKIWTDWEIAISIIKGCKNYYTKNMLEDNLTQVMNNYYKRLLGKKIWNHVDSVEVIKELEASKKLLRQNKLFGNGYRISS